MNPKNNLLHALRQQASTLADLGQFALTASLERLFDETVTRVAHVLQAEYCKVLRLQPDEKELLLVAGFGWQPGLVGGATVGTDLDSQAGYTLVSDHPVVVKDLRREDRFHGPALLHNHQVVSGISVIIRGRKQPFGVLGVHTVAPRDFTQDDIDFVAAVANILAAAVEQHRTDTALIASEERYRTITQMVTDYAYVASAEPEGVRVEWQSGDLAERLGYSVEQMTPEFWLSIIHPDDVLIYYRHTLERRQDKNAHYQIRAYDAQHRVRWLQVNSLMMLVNGRELVYGAIIDITERKQAEEEVLRLNTELEHRVLERTAHISAINKELESFSYSVSHDLRTPLRALDGFSLALLEDYGDIIDDEGRFYLGRIRDASQKMGQLIDDLLNLSRLTRTHLSLSEVSLSDIVREILEELQQTQPQRRAEFIIQPGLTAPGDARLLRIMFDNLLGNAWKFTNQKEDTRIEFGVSAYNNQMCYFVRDNGAGFDMNYAGKLFGAFQRLHNGEEFEGNGIGLATVQRIIHRHGGKIWAEGVLGEGAAFYFTLSVVKEESYEQDEKDHFAGRG